MRGCVLSMEIEPTNVQCLFFLCLVCDHYILDG